MNVDLVALENFSLTLVWTAIAIYALAFIAYAVDLARRSELVGAVAKQPLVAAAGRNTTTLVEVPAASIRTASGTVFARVGTSLTTLAFLFHLAGDVTRGISAGRVPWANNYEFALTGTLLVVAVYLGTLTRVKLNYLGSFITGLVVVLLGGSTLAFYVGVTPLMDPLKSVWLVVHVFVAALAVGFLSLSFALSFLQLLQARREQRAAAGEAQTGPKFLRTLPKSDQLESMAYRFTIIGFIFWTFTLICGAIWAQDAWGRYWAFDVKETWTFIIWVLYAGYIHARATRGWRGNASAWLNIAAYASVIFNFTIVNVFFKGLHSYSGL